MRGAPPSSDSVPEAALANCLRELPASVVLRNEEDLFGNLHRGGDVDLLVRDLDRAERTLIRHLGPPLRITRHSYVTGYFYDWGHIDLLPSIEWRGACYLQTEVVLDSRRLSERGRPVPRLAHESLISWLTSLLWGGFFKERYAFVIREAVEVDGGAFRQSLMDVAGKKWGVRLWRVAADGHPETSARWTRALRQTIWWRACFRSPMRTMRGYLDFVAAELRLRLEPSVPWIAVLGSDGSGKSSVLKELASRFETCRYATLRTYHWRPDVIRTRKGSSGPVTDPHGKPCRGRIGSLLSLLLLTADWLIGYWTLLVDLRAKGTILAFDRMYFDLLVDPKRYRYGAGRTPARVFWSLLPKPDLVFFLDSAPDVLWRRKQEVPPAELRRQRQAYTTLVRQLPGGYVLNGSLPLSALVDEVERVIRIWMANRAKASLGYLPHSMISGPAGNDEVAGSRGAPAFNHDDRPMESGLP
jgi:thymidylate kinase